MIKHYETNPTPPSRVVVLGATGFVGRGVCQKLAEQNVLALPLSSRDIDLCSADSAERLAAILQPTDALVFISALTPDRGRDIATLMRNLTMGQQVSAALERSPCAHVIYISSDAVYDDNLPLVKSDSPCNPGSFHGVMHLAREVMLSATLKKIGTPFFIVRPCAVYGTGDPHNSYGPNRFVRTARKDSKIALFGQGEEIRDHVWISDLSRLVVAGVLHRTSGILNAATGKAVSFHDVAQLVTKHFPVPVKIEGSSRATPITHRHFDAADMIHAFPWFQYSPLEQGLASMMSEEQA